MADAVPKSFDQASPEDRAERASEIVHSLNVKVARFVFEEGVRHTEALQTAAHAIDARATQVATILFAAAALSAPVIGTELNVSSVLAVFATGLFIWGGLISFRAVTSGPFRAPGISPGWWWEGAMPRHQEFTVQDALAWAAREQQVMIDHACSENEQRGDALNASLRAGYIGAICVGLAATLKLWPSVLSLIRHAEG